MYQALYRKWRPRTFDDVVGQTHITETLKRQVAAGRLFHAYLFTGARGTGKTTCAKILARAVNCEAPQEGNPCNACPACLGIENGSILDVLELDAASNNGVDQIRALRDEAMYTPAAVKKRVYIIDEAHMLTPQAWNALLKILEEPPAHLMFILATTEPQKVLATIKSRCQQFAFKRILPGQIAQRLSFVARQEGIELTEQGAVLLARLADGGLRDALSLLDQCAGTGGPVDEQEILDALGLAGNLETAALMEQLARRNTAAVLERFARLYAAGKEAGALLGELSALTRDLLLRKTAPQGGAALLTGGYDEATMRALGGLFSAQRLLQMLSQIQETAAGLARSSNRRTDVELCLIRLSDEQLDQSFTGLSARLARLEERVAQGVPAAQAGPVSEPAPSAQDSLPPWEEDRSPVEEAPDVEYVFEEPAGEPLRAVPPLAPASEEDTRPVSAPTALQGSAPAPDSGADERDFWPSFAAGLKGKVPPSALPYLNNAGKVTGIWKNGMLTLWVDSEFTRSMLNKPAVLDGLAKAAAASFGGQPQVSVVTGVPPARSASEADPLDALLSFGDQFDNITIQ